MSGFARLSPSDRTRRALVFYPYLIRPGSGALGVVAWIVHALQSDHEVTVLCRSADLEAVNRRYGTAIDPRRVRVEIARLPLLERIPHRLLRMENVRRWAFDRIARRRAPHFDLVICPGNEADLGGRGLQYVHDPNLVYRPRGGKDLGWYHAATRAGAVYFEIASRLVGFSYARMCRNLTLVPSQWVAEWVHHVHGIDAVVLHPPAAGTFPDVPWDARSDGVVWCGRLHPAKRVELVIEIVERVRALGVPATLTLAGVCDDPRDAYRLRIRALAAERADWLTLHENLDRDALCRLMVSHRYGLHGTTEGFGMAVAELVRAGAIVFVPRGGGQVEIVAHDDRLMYWTAEEAAQTIARTLRDPTQQDALRTALAPMRERFSSERFVEDFRRIVLAASAASPFAGAFSRGRP